MSTEKKNKKWKTFSRGGKQIVTGGGGLFFK
jgi:hypothetical protein